MAKARKAKGKPGKFRRAFTWAFKPFVNIFDWVGLRNIATQARFIGSSAKTYFVPRKAEHPEKFNEAVKRLHLSEDDLLQKQNNFLKLAIIFAVIGVLIVIYSIYVAWFGYFSSFLLTLTVGILAFACAFRYHFWWFQVKQRKLGCTIKEWLASGFGEERKK